jgi:RNA polymerase sigma-70 factor (ECF subfamily)
MNDTAAFIEVLERHDRGLRALAYRLLRDRQTMDDVMQEAYLKAFRGYSGFRGEAQSSTWLYRIVYNACLDRLRSERGRREVSLDQLAEWSLEPMAGGADQGEAGRGWATGATEAGDPAVVVARRGDLAAALAALPPHQRAAVLLVDAMGFSYDEAAAVVGARPGTIGSRLNHARSALRDTLAEGSDHERS